MKFLEKLVHSIVPHPKHRNIPHILQHESLAGIAVFVILLFVINQNNFHIIRGLDLTGAIYPAVIADLTNTDRAQNGIAPLAWSETLEEAARLKAEDMANSGYFAHTSPTGVTPWFWLEQVEYEFIYAGENLAIDFTESDIVHQAWLDSPSHRDNVLGKNFTEIGIAAIDGNFSGRDTTFVVEFFGKPLRKVALADTETIAKENSGAEENPGTPEVAGASAENKPSVNIDSLRVITSIDQVTEKLIAVENTKANKNIAADTPVTTEKMASWYTRLAIDPSNAIKTLYGIVLALLTISLSLLLKKEYEHHHTKHLVMGLALIALTGALFYIIAPPATTLAF